MNYALVSIVVNRVNVRVCHLQWNSVNTASIGPKKKIGRINGVAVLTTAFLQENVWRFLPGSQNYYYMLYISRLSLQQQQKNSWSE